MRLYFLAAGSATDRSADPFIEIGHLRADLPFGARHRSGNTQAKGKPAERPNGIAV